MDLISQIKQEQATLEQAVELALQQARSAGADQAEVAITRQTGISVNSRMKEVESVEFNHDGALGITVYHKQRKGSASTSDLSAEAIANAVKAAMSIASFTSADPCSGLADAELMAFDAPELELCFPRAYSPDEAIALAVAAETAALAADKRIQQSDGGSFNSHYGIKVYGNSHGLVRSYASSRHSLSCVTIGEQAGQMQRDYSYTVARDVADLWTPEQVGQDAVRRTLARLGARKIPTCEVPVIFNSDIASSLLGHLVMAISGGNLYRQASFLLDSLGSQIFPKWFNVRELPHLAKGLASAPFDAEGVRTRELEVIKEGVLQSYLLTSYAARKLAMQPTGHAGGIHNWLVQSSTDAGLQGLCRQMGTGLLVTELMGQGVNIVTGDYSRGAAGFWVENGELAYPVEEITIAGNLRTMFANLVAIGNDIDPRTSVKTDSILVAKMKVAGH